MKNEVLLRAIGNIDDKLIADAERETRGEKNTAGGNCVSSPLA